MVGPARTSMHLSACTAEELMHPGVKSISEASTVGEAVEQMIQESLRAAPVVNEGGRPVGVVSTTDILIHDQERDRPYGKADHPSLVRDIMTPTVFSVGVRTPAPEVIEHLKSLKVHHLFVVDENGKLVGVITPMDVVKRLEAVQGNGNKSPQQKEANHACGTEHLPDEHRPHE